MSENFGIKISKPGKSVDTAVDADLHYSSRFNILKVFLQETVDLTYNGTTHSGTTTQYSHSLNFTPTFLAYLEAQAGKWALAGTGLEASDLDYVGLDAFTDTVQLNLTPRVSTASSRYGSNLSLNCKLFIFGDTAKEASTTTNLPAGRNYGIKITKTGVSTSSKVIENLLFDSEMSSLMIKTQGSQNITSGGLVTVAHGLSYIPAYLLMVSEDGVTYYPTMFAPSIGGDSAYGWVDSTNLNIRSFNFPGFTHYFKYIIFANKIA